MRLLKGQHRGSQRLLRQVNIQSGAGGAQRIAGIPVVSSPMGESFLDPKRFG
ncbi:MAG: hypothetical protein OHK0039_22200 [Bacteroidia bacterium]